MTTKRCASALLACLLAGSVAYAADSIPSLERAGFEHIREGTLRANLFFLASDGMRGRMSLEPGDDAAAAWVAAEFAKAGLEPTSPNANAPYLQAVPLIEFRPDRESNLLRMNRKGQQKG